MGNSDVDLTFKGGREDCATSPGDEADHEYPDPIMNREEMFDWFANHEDGFGMNADQVKNKTLTNDHITILPN